MLVFFFFFFWWFPPFPALFHPTDVLISWLFLVGQFAGSMREGFMVIYMPLISPEPRGLMELRWSEEMG